MRSSRVFILGQLDTATNKAKQTVKQLATKGDVKSARILAKEVVRSNKQKDRISVSKARLGSIGHQLSQQMGALHASSTLSLSPSPLPESYGQGHRIAAEIH